jgi:hypothetical protein
MEYTIVSEKIWFLDKYTTSGDESWGLLNIWFVGVKEKYDDTWHQPFVTRISFPSYISHRDPTVQADARRCEKPLKQV